MNEVISQRVEKKQSVRWTMAGAQRLLQVRLQVLDGELGEIFRRWYPDMPLERELEEQRPAA